MTKARYSKNSFIPSTIFNAPRFVILVAGPVIMNAAAGIERHPDGRRHQHPEALVRLAEEPRKAVRGDILLEQGGQQNSKKKPLAISSYNIK